MFLVPIITLLGAKASGEEQARFANGVRMGQQTKRQHYLPRCWLNGFTDPRVPEGHEPWLWRWHPQVSAWTRRAPHNVGFGVHFYSIKGEDGDWNTAVEKGLGRIETAYGPIIKRLVRRQELDERQQQDLALFVATMMTRVPWWHEIAVSKAEKEADRLLEGAMRDWVEDPAGFLESRKRWVRARRRSTVPDLTAEDMAGVSTADTPPPLPDQL